MKIMGVTEEQVLKACEGICKAEMEWISKSRRGGDTLRVKLYPLKSTKNPHHYQRKSASFFHPDRWVHALCWYGFREFFKVLFTLAPNAKAITAMATYDGMEGFEKNYPATGYVNIGAPICPIQAREACECEDF